MIKIGQAYGDFWHRAFESDGCSTRLQFWVPLVVNFLVWFVLEHLIGVHAWVRLSSMSAIEAINLAQWVWLWLLVIPSINVYLRRIHDVGASAKFIWLLLIPIANLAFLWVLVLILCFDSNTYTQHFMKWHDRDERQIKSTVQTSWIWIVAIVLALISSVLIYRYLSVSALWPDWLTALLVWLDENWHLNILV